MLFGAAVALITFHYPAWAQADRDDDDAVGASTIETVTVSSTRSGKRLEDEPIHVEMIDADDLAEGTVFNPGQIGQALGEMSGIRLQVTAPSLGGANLSIQGLKGHYTQILSDGLPLYGVESESLGALQIPPADLKGVEVIKGIASALYGSSALGGVVNLISRHPGKDFEQQYVLNGTTLNGQDFSAYLSGPISDHWGFAFLGGLNRQSEGDLNRDGWADVPGYNRAVVRPRLFWDDGEGDTLLVTAGATLEGRHGGTLTGNVAPDGSPFLENQNTKRFDFGTVGRFKLDNDLVLNLRASAMDENDGHVWGSVTDRDDHAVTFGEASVTGASGKHVWTAGAAMATDVYHSRQFSPLNYTYTAPALFAQDEFDAMDWLTIAASTRVDFHNRYGTFISPRLSALAKLDDWIVRSSVGTGNYAPTPFTEETAETGLARVQPFQNIKPERARSASFDVSRTFGGLELDASVFGSIIDHPVRLSLSPTPGQLQFANVSGPTRTVGTELQAIYRLGELTLTGGYVYLDSTEIDPVDKKREEVDLTPKNEGTFRVDWEEDDDGDDGWKLGFEAFYTGPQSLNDPLDPNPYRSRGAPYVLLGALAEYHITKTVAVFVNSEDLTDVRQTKFDPLLRPTRAPDGNWTVNAWAPLDGRTFNGGLVIKL